MPFGDFGNFGRWSPKDQALNKMVYDEAHKKGSGGGNNNNPGCAVVFVIVIAVILIVLFSR